VAEGDLFQWNPDSTYIQEPPFFVDMAVTPAPIGPITGARVLAKLGNSVTTDHISPAGNIAKSGPAGRFLVSRGVAPADFNSVRRAARQRPRHDPRHVRQHPHQERDGPGHRGRCHDLPRPDVGAVTRGSTSR
jgi:aconitase A